MASELEPYFEDAEERRAYEAFCAEQECGDAGFTLGAPALVCRWRMANKKVPLLNRHIRALAHRRVIGAPLTHNMLSWAKQHVEWSLAEGSYAERDGVLMLVIDVNGNAAMTVGGYEPLGDTSCASLAARADAARAEQAETGVAPELLGAAADGRLLVAAAPDEPLCGAASLLVQVAQTRGREVACVLPASNGAEGEGATASSAPASHAVRLHGVAAPGADGSAAVHSAAVADDALPDAGAQRASATNGTASAAAPLAEAPEAGQGIASDSAGGCADARSASSPLVEALRAASGATPAFFLVSDEHGVVPADNSDASRADAALVATLAADCRKLFA